MAQPVYSLPHGYQLERISSDVEEKFIPGIPIFDLSRLDYYSEPFLRKILHRLKVSIDTNDVNVADAVGVKLGQPLTQQNLLEYLIRVFGDGKFLKGEFISSIDDRSNLAMSEKSIYLTQYDSADTRMRIVHLVNGQIGYNADWNHGKLRYEDDRQVAKKYDANGLLIELRSWEDEPHAVIINSQLAFQHRIIKPGNIQLLNMSKDQFNAYMIGVRTTIVDSLIDHLPKELGNEVADYFIDSLNGIRFYQ